MKMDFVFLMARNMTLNVLLYINKNILPFVKIVTFLEFKVFLQMIGHLGEC